MKAFSFVSERSTQTTEVICERTYRQSVRFRPRESVQGETLASHPQLSESRIRSRPADFALATSPDDEVRCTALRREASSRIGNALLELSSGNGRTIAGSASTSVPDIIGASGLAYELENWIDLQTANIAGATGRDPERVRRELAASAREAMERVTLDPDALAEEIATRLSVAANEVNRVVQTMSRQQLEALLAEEDGGVGMLEAVCRPPTEMATSILRGIGSGGGDGDDGSDLDPEAIAGTAGVLARHLAERVSPAFGHFGLDPADFGDHLLSLQKAAVILAAHGIDTPGKADRFLDGVRSHDDFVALATGLLGQAGYAAALACFNYAIADRIAPGMLAKGGFGAYFGFGACAGLLVGYADSVTSAAASSLSAGISYVGSGPLQSEAASRMQKSTATQIGMATLYGTGATAMKNFLLRVVLQNAAYAAFAPAGVGRKVRDGIDYGLDAGGAFVSGAAARLMTRRALDTSESLDLKILAQENLADVIRKSTAPLTAADVLNGVRAYGGGMAKGLVMPSTLAVTGLVITPLVASLIGVNGSLIQQGLGTVSAARSAFDSLRGNAVPTAAAVDHSEVIFATESLVKSLVSLGMMSALAAGATVTGNVVGRNLDGRMVTAVVNCLRPAVQDIEQTPVVEEPEVPEEIEMRNRRPPVNYA